MSSSYRPSVTLLAAALALAACAESAEQTDKTPDAGKVLELAPCQAETCPVTVTVTGEETSARVSWALAEGADPAKWWILHSSTGSFDLDHKAEVADPTAREVLVTGLEKDTDYSFYVAGVTEEGTVAEVNGAPMTSAVVNATTRPPVWGAPRVVSTTGIAANPLVMAFKDGTVTLVYRESLNALAAISTDGGATWSSVGVVDPKNPREMRAAHDPDRGVIVICYLRTDGLAVATSLDRGNSWTTTLLWSNEGASETGEAERSRCGVAMASDGAFLVASDARLSDEAGGATVVRVRRTEDLVDWTSIDAVEREDQGDLAIAADPVERVIDGEVKRFVYLAFANTNNKNIHFAVSSDGGRTFKATDKNGYPLELDLSSPYRGSQANPVMVVAPDTGRVWVAVEDRRTVEAIVLGNSDDHFATSPAGSSQWRPGGTLGKSVRLRNPSLVVDGDKLLVAFAAATTSNNLEFAPYLTRFYCDEGCAKGTFEAPQAGAAKDLLLGDSYLAANSTVGPVFGTGPVLASDGASGRFAVWISLKNTSSNEGDLQFTSNRQ